MNQFKNAANLIFCLVLCFSAAATGWFFKPGEWHVALIKPSWNPPNWIFAPAWTLLYILMSVALWRILKNKQLNRKKMAVGLFGIQLFLNALWTPLFFGFHRIDLGLVDIVLLWMAILATLISFYKRDVIAGLLLFPYLAWVTFATMLNAAIFILNPSL